MIKWTLHDQEADFIMALIRQRPHAEVDALVQKLLKQANEPQEPKNGQPDQP